MQPAENPPSACAGSWVWRSGRAQPRHAAAEPLAPAGKTNTARRAAPRRPGCPRAWPQPQAFSSCRTFHDKEGFQERSLGTPGGGEQEPGSGGKLAAARGMGTVGYAGDPGLCHRLPALCPQCLGNIEGGKAAASRGHCSAQPCTGLQGLRDPDYSTWHRITPP